MTADLIAVLGYSKRRDGALHPVCAHRLSHGQALASPAATVMLSGEAELMRAAWAGPDVVLVCDPEARSTADNARNIAAAARELGAKELVVVTSRWHRLRAGILLRAALRGSGVKVRIATTHGPRPFPLVAREWACLALLPFQLVRVVPDRAPGTTQRSFANAPSSDAAALLGREPKAPTRRRRPEEAVPALPARPSQTRGRTPTSQGP